MRRDPVYFGAGVLLFIVAIILVLFNENRKLGLHVHSSALMTEGTHIISAIMGGIDRHVAARLGNYHFFDDASPIPRAELSPRLRAKYFKMCGHHLYPHATALIWIDGSMEVKGTGLVNWMLGLMGDADCAFFKHDARRSVQDELDFCISNISSPYLQARYGKEPMAAQVQDYERHGYDPRSSGLVCCGLFIRRATPKVNAAFDAWFLENVKWSIQDQLSFPFIAWKHDLRVAMVPNEPPESIFESSHHRLLGHLNVQ